MLSAVDNDCVFWNNLADCKSRVFVNVAPGGPGLFLFGNKAEVFLKIAWSGATTWTFPSFAAMPLVIESGNFGR